MKNNSDPIEIFDNIYWVGKNQQINNLQCNPYLIIDNYEGVLIDPGSPLDFEVVFDNVKKLLPIEKIKYIVLQHQDPDFCAGVPLFEAKGFKGKIICHWRTFVIITYYGLKSEFFISNQNSNQLILDSGRQLLFLHTPYLHFPGAIVTYDSKSKILFSSDLFGAFSLNWSPFADDSYIETMKAFHEHYMPGNENLRPIMEMFLKMDIKVIAPQHGSIIKDHTKKFIEVLRDLECGSFLKPIKKKLAETGGYMGICNELLKRYYSIFPENEVKEVFDASEIILDEETLLIKDFNLTGKELWDSLFQLIYTKKGIAWLSIVEPLVRRIASEYEIDVPSIYKSALFEIEDQINKLSEENKKLQELNQRLVSNLEETQDKLIKCPITKLYNENFFRNYLNTEVNISLLNNENLSILFINIDNISKIDFDYGGNMIDEVLINLSFLLNDSKEGTHLLFKMEGPEFAYMIPNSNNEKTISIAEEIRNKVASSKIFIEPITVSIGCINLSEFLLENKLPEEIASSLMNTGRMRVRIAKNKGMNLVCSSSSIHEYSEQVGKILIVETDELNIDLLKTAFEQMSIEVISCNDGETALNLIEIMQPKVVIAEAMIPKADGFAVREKMLMSSSSKNIPFILISYQKDEKMLQRSLSLGIEHFFQKPYIFSEIIGIVKNKIRESK